MEMYFSLHISFIWFTTAKLPSYIWLMPINSHNCNWMNPIYVTGSVLKKWEIRVSVTGMVAETGETFRSQSAGFQMSVAIYQGCMQLL